MDFYSLRSPEDDRQRAVQALLPDLAKWHPICVEDLERWRADCSTTLE